MEILKILITFCFIERIESYSSSKEAYVFENHHDPLRQQYLILLIARQHLLLKGLRKSIYLPLTASTIIPAARIESNDDKYVNDYKNIDSKNFDNKLKDQDSRRLGVTFNFKGTGFSVLKDFKRLIRTSANSKLNQTKQLEPTQEEVNSGYQDKKNENTIGRNCTFATLNCITKCAKKYFNDTSYQSTNSEKWHCVLNCGDICGTTAF